MTDLKDKTDEELKEELKRLEEEIRERRKKVREIQKERERRKKEPPPPPVPSRLYRLIAGTRVTIPLMTQETVSMCQEVATQQMMNVFKKNRENKKVRVLDLYIKQEKTIDLSYVRVNIEVNGLTKGRRAKKGEWVGTKYIPPLRLKEGVRVLITELQKFYVKEKQKKRKKERYKKLFQYPPAYLEPIITRIDVHKRNTKIGQKIKKYLVLRLSG